MITNLKIGYNGRFGNQIFQFASLFGIANKLGYQVVIPSQNLNGVEQRTMDGKSFIAKFQLQECFDIDQSFFGEIYGVNSLKTEAHFHFDESMFGISDFTCIDGYFQTDKYFRHCKNELIDVLKFKDDILIKSKELLPKVQKELVSIHIRRGDYTHPNPYHVVVSEEYINNSINLFQGDNYHFVVFSDDINWVNDRIKGGYWGDANKFTIFNSDSAYIDFCAMSLCDHQIISNSSFSWWASYLSKNENKIVIAPERWFGPGYSHYITDDIYTENMIKIGDNFDGKTINILTICTGKYVNFFQNFYNSCEEYFLTNFKKKYFVFTDGDLPISENIVKIQQNKLGWPYDTMMRFKMFNSIENILDGDYVFFFNANMLFVDHVGVEVIPTSENDYLMGVIHPGYFNRPVVSFPYERSKLSNFYIPFDSGSNYFQGCFNGGRKEDFMKMSNLLESKIDDDGRNGIIPIWHDESALNWYYSSRNPLKLSYLYAFPESYNKVDGVKIIQLDKSKLGGHDFLRS